MADGANARRTGDGTPQQQGRRAVDETDRTGRATGGESNSSTRRHWQQPGLGFGLAQALVSFSLTSLRLRTSVPSMARKGARGTPVSSFYPFPISPRRGRPIETGGRRWRCATDNTGVRCGLFFFFLSFFRGCAWLAKTEAEAEMLPALGKASLQGGSKRKRERERREREREEGRGRAQSVSRGGRWVCNFARAEAKDSQKLHADLLDFFLLMMDLLCGCDNPCRMLRERRGEKRGQKKMGQAAPFRYPMPPALPALSSPNPASPGRRLHPLAMLFDKRWLANEGRRLPSKLGPGCPSGIFTRNPPQTNGEWQARRAEHESRA